MKRRAIALLAVTGFSVGVSQMASAADLPVKAPLYASNYNWSGFYVGGHVGGAWSTTDYTGNTFLGGLLFPERFTQGSSSWIAGGQFGYLYQFKPNWIAGVEMSWSGTDLSATSTSLLFLDRSRQSKIKDLILVTGSLGYASNNWLGYIKGGYANADLDITSSVTSTGQPSSASSGRENGWTLGGGIEYGIHPNISVGVEYNFVRLNIGDRNQFVFPGFAGSGTVTDAHADIHTMWARLNFRFGTTPVVAKH